MQHKLPIVIHVMLLTETFEIFEKKRSDLFGIFSRFTGIYHQVLQKSNKYNDEI
jgi:hypothetical protein